jgi:putative addiction module CopG family antidote
MGTMNISLPDALKTFVDEQVAARGYGTSSEYVRELIRADRDRCCSMVWPRRQRSMKPISRASRIGSAKPKPGEPEADPPAAGSPGYVDELGSRSRALCCTLPAWMQEPAM